MKNIILLLFFIVPVIILPSCKSVGHNQQELTGKIGKFSAKIVLNNEGDKYWGDFKYLELEKAKIKLEGVKEGDRLVLQEFDKDKELQGTFEGEIKNGSYEGYWRSPEKTKKVFFKFRANKFSSNTSTKDILIPKRSDLASLDPKELIKIHFDPFKYEGKKRAYYKKDGYDMEVEFEKIENYIEDGSEYAIVFFSSYYLEDGGERASAHVASGLVSIAKYKRRKGKWALMKFKFECGCGYGAWGEVELPKLEKCGSFYFLVSESGYLNQGYFESYLFLCNTTDFGLSLKLDKGGSNEGALDGGLYIYDSEYVFVQEGKRLLMKVEYNGNNYPSKSKNIIYYYDEENLVFNEL